MLCCCIVCKNQVGYRLSPASGITFYGLYLLSIHIHINLTIGRVINRTIRNQEILTGNLKLQTFISVSGSMEKVFLINLSNRNILIGILIIRAKTAYGKIYIFFIGIFNFYEESSVLRRYRFCVFEKE